MNNTNINPSCFPALFTTRALWVCPLSMLWIYILLELGTFYNWTSNDWVQALASDMKMVSLVIILILFAQISLTRDEEDLNVVHLLYGAVTVIFWYSLSLFIKENQLWALYTCSSILIGYFGILFKKENDSLLWTLGISLFYIISWGGFLISTNNLP